MTVYLVYVRFYPATLHVFLANQKREILEAFIYCCNLLQFLRPTIQRKTLISIIVLVKTILLIFFYRDAF